MTVLDLPHSLTKADFARHAARIAKLAADWAWQSLFKAERNEQMRRDEVHRFTAEIAQILTRIRESAGLP